MAVRVEPRRTGGVENQTPGADIGNTLGCARRNAHAIARCDLCGFEMPDFDTAFADDDQIVSCDSA